MLLFFELMKKRNLQAKAEFFHGMFPKMELSAF